MNAPSTDQKATMPMLMMFSSIICGIVVTVFFIRFRISYVFKKKAYHSFIRQTTVKFRMKLHDKDII